MKKLLALILALTMALCLVSCGDEPKTEEPKSPAIEDEKPVSAPAELPEPTPLLTSEDTAKKFFEALVALDVDTLFDLCVDPVSLDAAIASGEYEDKESLYAVFAEEVMDEYEDDILALGENRGVTRFDVIEIIDVPREELGDNVKYVFMEGDASIPATEVESAVVVTAAITIAGDADQISMESCNTPLIKVDGRWYVGTFLMSVTAADSDIPTTYVD